MSGPTNDLRMIETLSKSAETVLKRLIRFLVGKISLVKLQEMVRYIYVEEAENQLKSENPSRSVALTKLALLTGLDTRTLTRIRNSERYGKPTHQDSSFLREAAPVATILDAWGSVSEFIDPVTSTPKKLKLRGELDSFERLFETTIRSRGITQQSILSRLVLNGAVIFDSEHETVELVKQTYLPVHSDEQLGAVEVGYAAAANLMDTIVHNFESETDKFFQRGVWTTRLSPKKRKSLRKSLNLILERAERESRELLLNTEEKSEHSSQMTAGVSLFYFEDNVSKIDD